MAALRWAAAFSPVGAEAFYMCQSLGSVALPGSLTNIGVDAFGSCWDLTNAAIPNGVTSIGVTAFILRTDQR